jgi:hypothetical protein
VLAWAWTEQIMNDGEGAPLTCGGLFNWNLQNQTRLTAQNVNSTVTHDL